MKLGAEKVVIDDRRAKFVEEFIYPSLSYGGIYQGRYLLGTSLARPLIVQGLVKTAQQENIKLVAHGATGKGNDQIRMELSSILLDPEIQVFRC